MGLFKKKKVVEKKHSNDHQVDKGNFIASVLLLKPVWDKHEFIHDLAKQWGILAKEEDNDKSDDILLFHVDDMIATICLMPVPIPNGEADENAKNNFMWKEAQAQTHKHQAHFLVTILGEGSVIEKGKLFVKLIATTCLSENTLGIHTSGTVFEPSFYFDFAEMMKEDLFPVFNLIWFGLYRNQNGVSGYTYGMDVFGKDDMEMLNTNLEPSKLRDILSDLVLYVIEHDVVLQDGETIGFSENQKWPITKSKGVSLPTMTLKITYQ